MTHNPRDYDVSELDRIVREAGGPLPGADNGRASGDDGTPFEWVTPSPPGELLQSSEYRELMLLGGMSGGFDEKPYLDDLPANYAAECTIFEWLHFLLSTGGLKRSLEALRYYESVGWLGPDARDGVEEYLLGLEEPDDADDAIDREDHARTLVYVARLAAIDG